MSQRIESLLVLLMFLVTGITSCSFFQKEKQENKPVVARAFDYYLYREDLDGVVPFEASSMDSLNLTRNFIDNWIRQKAVLHTAERNLDDEKKKVEKQLQEYRNSLITFAYESELIRQKLDTNVSESEVAEFYQQHPNNFELKDNIIKVIYLKLNKKSPKLNKVMDWYKSDVKKDRLLLEEYCHQYAINYFLDDSTWLFFDDLLKEIPIKTYDKDHFLQNNRNIEIEDSTNIYLVSIKGFKIKNSISPLSFERNNIRTLIINHRKLQLVEKMEHDAYEDARKNGDAEVF